MKHFRFLIIGGGIAGCSLAYHLARIHGSDVALLERSELTAGSTWHAAGNCARFSHNPTTMRLRDYSIELYRGLEDEVGDPGGYKLTGGLRPARNRDRMDEYRYVRSVARRIGYEFELVSPEEIQRLHPLLDVGSYIGALYDQAEGNADPSQATQAMAKGARTAGASIFRHSPVMRIAQGESGEWQVDTPEDIFIAEVLVNAAGLWAREIGKMTGLDVPIVPMQHHYLVTETVPGLEERESPLPLFRDCDESFYLRQERDGLIVGPYESRPAPWAVNETPSNFGMELLAPEFDRIEPILDLAMQRVPALKKSGVKTVINGAITFTPDGNSLMGPVHGLRNYFLMTGFSAGIMEAGGAGWMLADWISEGLPPYDMSAFDPRRFGDFADPDYVLARAMEIYPKTYAIGFPFEELLSGRPRKTSAIHDKLAAHGAVFGARYGWERPNWFAIGDSGTEDVPSFRRTNWFSPMGEECRAVMQDVGLIDLTAFAKFEVSGPDAATFLDRVTTNLIPGHMGQIRLSYALNPKGGIECEFIITRIGEEQFYLTAAAIARRHHLDWLNGARQADESVDITDVTEERAILVLAGPRSRELLSSLTDAGLDNESFPWLSGREIMVAGLSLWALRMNYVGELGWELHHSIDQQEALYKAILDVGQSLGLRHVGMRALEPLRIEKGYAAWGFELSSEYTPLQAGLGRFVALDSKDFIGRSALLKRHDAKRAPVLAMIEIDADEADTLGNEPVLYEDTIVGLVTSGSYGFRVTSSLAFAYLDSVCAMPGTSLTVEILGEPRAARVVETPVYDPGNLKSAL